MKTSIHNEAKQKLSILTQVYYDPWRDEHPSCPDWIAKKILASMRRGHLRAAAKEGIAKAAEKNTAHLYRDFRPEGSGRSAHWSRVYFRRIQVVARCLHRDGFSGDLGKIAKELVLVEYLPNFDKIGPFSSSIKTQERDSYGHVKTKDGQKWYEYYEWLKEGPIAEMEAEEVINSTGPISGYLADSILSWRAGRSGYEGSSGCVYMYAIRRRPETWDELMSRAPRGKSGPGWAQVFPHEHERAAELRAQGAQECFRLNDSVFTF